MGSYKDPRKIESNKEENILLGSKKSFDLSEKNQTHAIPLDIVIIDDNADDVLVSMNLLNIQKVFNKPKHFNDPKKALNYLIRSHDYVKRSVPDIVLLDYSMPIMDGIEVLKELREHPSTYQIPIFILTNTEDPEFIAIAKKYNVDGVFKKPIHVGSFIQKIITISGFGLMIAKRCSEKDRHRI